MDLFKYLRSMTPLQVGSELGISIIKKLYSTCFELWRSQAAESPADFIHKMKLVLKEIRETRVNLRIINEKPFLAAEKVTDALRECNELMAIFLKSIDTAKNNDRSK